MNRRNLKVYVAGAIQGESLLHALRNIDHGQAMTAKVFQLGFSPFPVFCDATFIQRVRPVPPIQDVYNYSLEWLKASDAMFCIEGWEKSVGCKAEIAIAKEYGIPVFFDLVDMCAWADREVEVSIDNQLRRSDD